MPASIREDVPEHRPQLALSADAPDALTAGLAHDLRNLLAAIGLFSDLLLRTTPLSSIQQRYAKEIGLTATRGMDLVRQFIPGTRKTAPRTFCAVHLLQQMRPMLERLVGDRVELKLDIDTSKAAVHADPRQIERVILNLVVNARDAMPQGGQLRVAISAIVMNAAQAGSWPAPRPPLPPGSYVMVTVEDTGCGMDAATAALAFQPFFTTKDCEGIGLGLSIVRFIMARHGGGVSLDSTPGRGTRVRIVLPSAVSSAAPAH